MVVTSDGEASEAILLTAGKEWTYYQETMIVEIKSRFRLWGDSLIKGRVNSLVLINII